MSQYKIAVIPGDGIGTEVMPEGIRAMDAVARRFGIDFQWDHFDFSSYAYFEKHGKMLPDDWFDTLTKYDAIYFGAVGWPAKMADHVSLWGSLLQFRRSFDQYVNLRPVRLITVSCTTISRSVFGNMRPPMLEYSPSVFSRTT